MSTETRDVEGELEEVAKFLRCCRGTEPAEHYEDAARSVEQADAALRTLREQVEREHGHHVEWMGLAREHATCAERAEARVAELEAALRNMVDQFGWHAGENDSVMSAARRVLGKADQHG